MVATSWKQAKRTKPAPRLHGFGQTRAAEITASLLYSYSLISDTFDVGLVERLDPSRLPDSVPTRHRRSSRGGAPGIPRMGGPEDAPIKRHDLRHTCATILLMAGEHPKYVQELLVNASISITLDTYSRLIEDMDGGLSDAMDGTLRCSVAAIWVYGLTPE